MLQLKQPSFEPIILLSSNPPILTTITYHHGHSKHTLATAPDKMKNRPLKDKKMIALHDLIKMHNHNL